MDIALDEVTTQSARALTAADVLQYTTTVRSAYSSQNSENWSTGQPKSKEHVASTVGINTRFCGLKILALSPMNRTPAIISVDASFSTPNCAIAKESPIKPPVVSANR